MKILLVWLLVSVNTGGGAYGVPGANPQVVQSFDTKEDCQNFAVVLKTNVRYPNSFDLVCIGTKEKIYE